MRKPIKPTEGKPHGLDVEPEGMRRPGSVVISWPSLITMDLITLLSKHPVLATVTGSPTRQEPTKQGSDHSIGRIALSDGTQVSFPAVGHFMVVRND